MSLFFDRRDDWGTISSGQPAEVLSGWQGDKESWLFLSPHDDDIVCGAGLTFLAAIRCGIDVHAGVVSNGRMGYCTPEQRETIRQVRYEETRASFEHLGLSMDRLYQFDYDDGSLAQAAGKRFAAPDDPNAIAGGTGIQNTLTWLLRKVRPTRVFLPNRLDLHPDHRAVHHETVISIFHAQGGIWPELGTPIVTLPVLYEYATYSDFVTTPTHRIRVPNDLVEQRLRGIALFKSQLQIELIVQGLRKIGGKEYLLEMQFEVFNPEKYQSMF